MIRSIPRDTAMRGHGSMVDHTLDSARLVVIIPCLNEQETVAQVIRAIPAQITGVSAIDIVVVDDGSTDETSQRAREAGAGVLKHPYTFGLGRTFRDGMDRALALGADIIVNIDGDGQFNAADIPRLIEPLLIGQADFVSASRFKDPQLTPRMPKIKRWGNARIASLVSWLTGQRFYDVSCGFRAYTRDTALNLNLLGIFTYTQESFLDLAFKNCRIAEVPMRVRGEREYGESRIAGNLFRYAIQTSTIILRTFRDYRPLVFFGAIAHMCGIVALGLFVFLFIHYLRSGSFSPHIWAGMTGGFLGGCALLIFVLGQTADMLCRQRATLEKLLYLARRESLEETPQPEVESQD